MQSNKQKNQYTEFTSCPCPCRVTCDHGQFLFPGFHVLSAKTTLAHAMSAAAASTGSVGPRPSTGPGCAHFVSGLDMSLPHTWLFFRIYFLFPWKRVSPSGPHSGRQESCQGEGPASLWVPPQARYELLQMSGGTAAFGKRKFQHPWALADIYMSFKNNILAVTVPRRKMGPGLLGGGKQPRRAREPGCSPACACLHVSIRGSGYLVELGANLRLLPRQACSSLQGGKRGMKLEILLSSEEILSRNVCTFPCFSQSTRIPKHPK